MTEHKAAKICNAIYADLAEGLLDKKLAAKLLFELSPYMSAAQFVKYNDFLYNYNEYK